MTEQSASEHKEAAIQAMGQELGEIFAALWQDVAITNVYWAEYVELYGTKPTRIKLMNNAASFFFHMLQEELWLMNLLHLSRLTDPAVSPGKPVKTNLSIRALVNPITDALFKVSVARLCTEAEKATEFARDARNRIIAHTDLKLALNHPTDPLKDGSRAQVKEALVKIAETLNAVAKHYGLATTRFDMTPRAHGASDLVLLLDEAVEMREARFERIKAGTATPADFKGRDI